MSRQHPADKASQSLETDAQINALLGKAYQINMRHPDAIHEIQKLRDEIEHIESHPYLTEYQKNKLALIRVYACSYHEYVHILNQIHHLDAELHHTEPSVHNEIYFSQVTLRLMELCSMSAKKEATIHEALNSLKNLSPD